MSNSSETQVVFLNNAPSNAITSATIEHIVGDKQDTYTFSAGQNMPAFGELSKPAAFTNVSNTTDEWRFSVTFTDTIHGEHTWTRGPESLLFVESKDGGRMVIVSISDQGGNWGEHDNGPTATVAYASTCDNWNLHT